MTPNMRACIAFIAGSIVQKRQFSAVYDQAEGMVRRLTGTFSSGNIDVIDHSDGSTLMGMMSGQTASFFHSVANCSISLQFNGAQFTGHDGATGRNFNGSVQGGGVRLYDYDEGKYFSYVLADEG
jgi:hypothetical protein